MNAKHTQGPWQVLHDASVVGPDEVQEDGSIHVQSIARMALCQELMANARLIAAAPELLEALEALVKRVEYYSAIPEDQRPTIEQWEYTEGSSEMSAARAALAKAKGGAL